MAKRSAYGDGDKDVGLAIEQDDPANTAQKATSSQMSGRRIASAKGVRRPAGMSSRNLDAQIGNPFAPVAPNTVNGNNSASPFAFGQSSNNGFGNQSAFGQNSAQSFPPTTSGLNSFGNTSTSSSFPAPQQQSGNIFGASNGGFTFGAGAGASNPFANLKSQPTEQKQNGSTGFNFGASTSQPSMFGQGGGFGQPQQENPQSNVGGSEMQISPPATPSKSHPVTQNQPSIFGTMAGSSTTQTGEVGGKLFSNFQSPSPQAQPTAPNGTSTNLFSFGQPTKTSATPSQSSTNNIFKGFGVQQQSSSTNMFGGALSQSIPAKSTTSASTVEKPTSNSLTPTSGFMFGGSLSSGSAANDSIFKFGSTTTQPSVKSDATSETPKPASTGFVFGNPASQTPFKSSTATEQSKPTNQGFIFGQSTTQTPAKPDISTEKQELVNPTITSGIPALQTPTNSESLKPSSTGFVFGNSTSQSAAKPATSFNPFSQSTSKPALETAADEVASFTSASTIPKPSEKPQFSTDLFANSPKANLFASSKAAEISSPQPPSQSTTVEKPELAMDDIETSRLIFELRRFNKQFLNTLHAMDNSVDWTPLMESYISERQRFDRQNSARSISSSQQTTLEDYGADAVNGTKRSRMGTVSEEAQDLSEEDARSKRQRMTRIDEEKLQSTTQPTPPLQPNIQPQSSVFSPAKTSTGSAIATQSTAQSLSATQPLFGARNSTQTAASLSASTTSTQSPTKSATSNLFQNILSGGNIANSSPAPKSSDNASSSEPVRFNPFATLPSPGRGPSNSGSSNLFAPKSPTKASAVTAAPPPSFKPSDNSSTDAASPFTFKPTTSGSTSASGFAPKVNDSPAATSTGGFTFKPSTATTTTASAGFKPSGFTPSLSSSGTVDFFSQFGSQAASKTAEAEAAAKRKRKAEEFDSDEDDEAEWERKDAEKQALKKAKIEEERQKAIVFDPKKGFGFGTASENPASAKVDSTSSQTNPSRNLFAHLADSSTNGGQSNESEDDADESDEAGDTNEESASGQTSEPPERDEAKEQDQEQNESDQETLEEAARRSKKDREEPVTTTPGKSLFERIQKPNGVVKADENAKEQSQSRVESTNAKTPTANGTSIFGQSAGPASVFGSSTNSVGDHTWKPDSPIKFGQSTNGTSNPFNFTPATPTKAEAESAKTAANPFGGLFGGAKPISSPSLFSNISTTPTGSPAKPNFGFSFGAPPPKMDSLAPPTSSLEQSSRGTTPGTDFSGTESNVEQADGDAEPILDQSDLTALTLEELRDHEILFEIAKVRVSVFNKENKEQPWESKGLGPLRVLKNKEKGTTRVLVRAAPSGRVVLNSGLQSSLEYTNPNNGYVNIPVAEQGGKIATYLVRMGKKEDATTLKDVLERHKAEA